MMVSQCEHMVQELVHHIEVAFQGIHYTDNKGVGLQGGSP
jgi:hypothetical protein